MDEKTYWLKNGFDATIIRGTANEIIKYLEKASNL